MLSQKELPARKFNIRPFGLARTTSPSVPFGNGTHLLRAASKSSVTPSSEGVFHLYSTGCFQSYFVFAIPAFFLPAFMANPLQETFIY